MERRGLIGREEVAEDARGTVMVLTRGGLRAVAAPAPGQFHSVRRHTIDLLTEKQLETLADIAETVVRHLTDHSE